MKKQDMVEYWQYRAKMLEARLEDMHDQFQTLYLHTRFAIIGWLFTLLLFWIFILIEVLI